MIFARRIPPLYLYGATHRQEMLHWLTGEVYTDLKRAMDSLLEKARTGDWDELALITKPGEERLFTWRLDEDTRTGETVAPLRQPAHVF